MWLITCVLGFTGAEAFARYWGICVEKLRNRGTDRLSVEDRERGRERWHGRLKARQWPGSERWTFSFKSRFHRRRRNGKKLSWCPWGGQSEWKSKCRGCLARWTTSLRRRNTFRRSSTSHRTSGAEGGEHRNVHCMSICTTVTDDREQGSRPSSEPRNRWREHAHGTREGVWYVLTIVFKETTGSKSWSWWSFQRSGIRYLTVNRISPFCADQLQSLPSSSIRGSPSTAKDLPAIDHRY